MKLHFWKSNLLLIAFFLFSTTTQAQVGQIIWEENFNSYNSSIWNNIEGDGCPELCGFGNEELQYYHGDNVKVEEIPGEPGNYALVIEAKKENRGDQAFTSGKVTTENKLGVKYGMIEFRIKVPDNLATGLWPAAWLLGTNHSTEGWPRCGEIDIMEMGHKAHFRNEKNLGGSTENDVVGANLIFYDKEACNDGNPDCAASIAFDNYYCTPYRGETPLTDRFLTYRIYWDEDEMRFTVEDEGNVYNLYTAPFPVGSASTEFHKPFYFIMNLAVGGNFTDALTNGQVTADLPGKMYIDYIRVHQWNGKGEIYTADKLMANAGGNKEINTDEKITLDASGSYGPIESYSWSIGEQIISNEKKVEDVDLETGTHKITLTITDTNGNTTKDHIIVKVGSQDLGKVIWEDNFSELNTDHWNISIGDGCDEDLCGWGNKELQSYQSDNVYIEEIAEEPGNFALVLEAKKESAGNSAFTSGKVTSENKVAVKYGMIEVRMKVPDVNGGLWPAAWLLGVNHASVGWPQCGEIDIMEMGHSVSARAREGHGGSPNNYVAANLLWYTSQACDANNRTCAASIAYDSDYNTPYMPGAPMNNRFMTYRMYWDIDEIRLTAVDNGIEHDLYAAPFPTGEASAFKKPFYLLLNLAVGGAFPDIFEPEDVTVPLPGKVYIDYVKVHQWKGQGEVTLSANTVVADAGRDIEITDLDKDGIETITLDGSNSSGNIVSYEWSEGGAVLSSDPKSTLTFNAGVHHVQLKVTDKDGNTATDMMKIDVREILWEDQFNAFETNIWNAIEGDGCPDLCGWGNEELEYYHADNVFIEPIEGEEGNSALVLEARKENKEGAEFTSGKVTTENKVSIKYGLVEVRMKVPDNLATGLWPAAWLLGTNLPEVGWPRSGEIDMMEMGHRRSFRESQGFINTTENDVVGGNLIYYDDAACSGGNPDCAASIAFDTYYYKGYQANTALTDRFLIYRLYWNQHQMRLTVEDEGVEFDLYADAFPIGKGSEEFHKPFYFILNLAVGGTFTDAANSSQVTADLPGKMLVDYVRVLKWDGVGEVALNGGLIPNAGSDIIHLDIKGEGKGTIVLDGSNSAHHTGEIESYSWSIDGEEIATGEVAQVELNRGTYEVTLTITDTEGNSATDQVLVTITNGGLSPIANAGEDFSVNDDDDDDLVMVSLDGTASEKANTEIVSYKWFIGEQEIASGSTPSVELSTGIHTIRLEVTDEAELIGTDEIVVTVIDPNNQPPVANAGESITVVDDNNDDFATFTLNASASTDSDGNIEKYVWLIDGTEIARGINPTVTLSTGVYFITLEVTDDDGVTGQTEVKVIVVDPYNEAPVAKAGEDQLLIDEDLDGWESYTLDASLSTDSDGTIEKYVWKIGDTEIATDISVTVDLAVGDHIITLEVTDDDGETSTDELIIVVNQVPLANAGEDILVIDTDGNGMENVTLDASGSSDANGTIVKYSWMFNGEEIGTTSSFNYSFPVGTNIVTLHVFDNHNSNASDEIKVIVTRSDNKAPLASAGDDLEIMEDDGDEFIDVVLDGSKSSDEDGSIYSYVWYKGNVEIGRGVQPTVKLEMGLNLVTLVVTDNEGASASADVMINVIQRINVALNKTTTTSSEENGSVSGHNAVDGSMDTRWSSAFEDPQWIMIDLDERYNISEVVLHWEGAFGIAYEIQVSDDANEWHTIYTETNGDGETDILKVYGSCQYIRLLGTQRGTPYGYSLWEMEVYGQAEKEGEETVWYDITYVDDFENENPPRFVSSNSLELKDPSRADYIFGGWYTEASFENSMTEISKGNTEAVTLYAKWLKVNAITYIDGFSHNNPSTYTEGETIQLEPAIQSGYNFEGWYTDTAFTNQVTSIDASDQGEITLYAKWSTIISNNELLEKEKPVIYPIPVSDAFKINVAANSLKVYSLTGTILKSFDKSQTSYNISDLQTGVYIVQFIHQGKLFVHKIVKK
ncbi:PKD domain-containing protein [Flammeovirga sp. OC4]|uniref:PKD domain-containing protein n=1 Tax=Flammeovirga sp. OC4 TaxID=1382345 RepID=UPI0006935402|nr:PKD domain-containing protein [Flammeovirga sp. OC4]